MEIKKPVELAEPQPGRNSHVGTVEGMLCYNITFQVIEVSIGFRRRRQR
jgi:hypothetical protein